MSKCCRGEGLQPFQLPQMLSTGPLRVWPGSPLCPAHESFCRSETKGRCAQTQSLPPQAGACLRPGGRHAEPPVAWGKLVHLFSGVVVGNSREGSAPCQGAPALPTLSQSLGS